MVNVTSLAAQHILRGGEQGSESESEGDGRQLGCKEMEEYARGGVGANERESESSVREE